VVINFEGPRWDGVQVRVDGVGGVGCMLGVPSVWARWRGWGCCYSFPSNRWFPLHVCIDCCISLREGLVIVLRELGGFPCDFEGGVYDGSVFVLRLDTGEVFRCKFTVDVTA